MNGLKFIRKQCNFSLSSLAGYIGVSMNIVFKKIQLKKCLVGK